MKVLNPKDLLNMSLVENNQEFTSFAGPFTYDVIDKQLIEARAYIEGLKINIKSAKKIYFVLVEVLENILRHSEGHENRDAAYMIGKAENYFFIYTGNYTTLEEVNPLIEKIKLYNGMSKDDLTKLYKERLTSTVLSEKGGAGLGILSIAIKAENNLDYELIELENNKNLFRLFVRVNDYALDTIN